MDTGTEIRKRPQPEQRRLSSALKSIPSFFSAIGSSLLGATAFLVISGAVYYQTMLEKLGAAWAFDIVLYAAMVRAGALNAVAFLITTVITVLVRLSGLYDRKGMLFLFWLSFALTVVGASLYAWVPNTSSTGRRRTNQHQPADCNKLDTARHARLASFECA